VKKFVFSLLFGVVVVLGIYGLKVLADGGEFTFPIMSKYRIERIKVRRKMRGKRERFLKSVEAFKDMLFEQREDKNLWVDGKRAQPGEFFVQKLRLSSGDMAEFFTDIHSDWRAVKDWRIYAQEAGSLSKEGKLRSKNDFYLYMGDLVDRGSTGFLLIKFLIQLYQKNPDQTIWLKGNHSRKAIFKNYGFEQELKQKYGFNSEEREEIYELFDYLPSACFIIWKNSDGKKRGIICTHGGFPSFENYSPKKLIDSKTATYERLEYKACPLGGGIREFAWGDIHSSSHQQTSYNRRRRALTRGRKDTEQYLKKLSKQTGVEFVGIIRGHQHSGELAKKMAEGNGLAFLWEKGRWKGKFFFRTLQSLSPFVLTIAPFNYSLLKKRGILSDQAPLCKLVIEPEYDDCGLELDKQEKR